MDQTYFPSLCLNSACQKHLHSEAGSVESVLRYISAISTLGKACNIMILDQSRSCGTDQLLPLSMSSRMTSICGIVNFRSCAIQPAWTWSADGEEQRGLERHRQEMRDWRRHSYSWRSLWLWWRFGQQQNLLLDLPSWGKHRCKKEAPILSRFLGSSLMPFHLYLQQGNNSHGTLTLVDKRALIYSSSYTHGQMFGAVKGMLCFIDHCRDLPA